MLGVLWISGGDLNFRDYTIYNSFVLRIGVRFCEWNKPHAIRFFLILGMACDLGSISKSHAIGRFYEAITLINMVIQWRADEI